MSLTALLRNGTLGIGLSLGLSFFSSCSPSHFDNQRNDNQIACEEKNIGDTELDGAFDGAKLQVEEEQGYALRSGSWNDESIYTKITRYMIQELDCSFSAATSSRRQGQEECQRVNVIDDSRYHDSVIYCGPGAVERVEGDCNRIDPGTCLNSTCHTHDICYSTRQEKSETGELCLWSQQTEGCDDDFFNRYDDCLQENECDFSCRLIAAIARNLRDIERSYNAVGPGCLWDGTTTNTNTEKNKENTCYTKGCPEENCMFYDEFDNTALDTDCRWQVQQGAPAIRNGQAILTSPRTEIKTRGKYALCPSDMNIEIRSRLSAAFTSGIYNLQYGLVRETAIFGMGIAAEDNIRFSCSKQSLSPIPVNPREWHTFRIHLLRGTSAELYLDNLSRGVLPCTQEDGEGLTIFYGDIVDSQAQIEYVKMWCDER